MKLIALIGLWLSALNSGSSLICYKCKLTYGYPNPSCRHPDNESTSVEVCRKSSHLCSVERHINNVGHVTAESFIRRCSEPEPPGCKGEYPFERCTSQCTTDRCNVDNKSPTLQPSKALVLMSWIFAMNLCFLSALA